MNEDKIIQIKDNIIEEAVDMQSVAADTEDVSQKISANSESSLNIIVEDTNIIDIEMDEAFPSMLSNSDEEAINHSLLYGRDLSDQHPISAISGLRQELDSLESLKRVYSSENGLGEFRKWNDENPKWEDRSGYFVKIVDGTENIEVCTNEDDVYGIAVLQSGFVGGQDVSDKSDDPVYALVGITGTLRVRTDGTAEVGDYVVPNELGVAAKSENSCGYKVVSKGSYATYEYITIAATPQNDKINKIYGTLMNTEGSLGNIVVRIEEAESKVDGMSSKINIAIQDKEELKNLIEENTKNIASTSNEAKNAQEAANRATESANEAVNAANAAKDEALAAANEAKEQVNASLADINDLKADMTVISSFNDGQGNTGIQGFVNVTEVNSMTLGTLQESVNQQGTDITSINQQIKDTEATIQNLVVHSDKYSVGENSLSYGLSYDEAKPLLKDGDLYVSTSNHTEIMERTIEDPDNPDEPLTTTMEFAFERGYVYQWDATNMTWVKGASVSTATTYSEGKTVGDLWFCWQEVEYTDKEGEVRVLLPGTLYRWSEDEQWIAIATTDGNSKSRMISSIKQTADGIRATVTDLSGNVSAIDQKVGEVSIRVANTEGDVSSIKQEVDTINLTVSNHEGTIASIQEDVTDNSARVTTVAAGQFAVVYQSLVGAPPSLPDGQHKYTTPPSWDDEQKKFVFNDELIDDVNGQYYYVVNADGAVDETKYYKVLPDDSYEIYIVGNQLTSMFENYVTDEEAIARMVSKKVDEKTDGMTQTIAAVETKANTNEAKITQVANYYYHKLLYISETEIPVLDGQLRYSEPPEWDASIGAYVFDSNAQAENGAYYLADNQGTTYCCVQTAGDGSSVYEVYGLLANYIASIETGADEDGGYIQSMVLDIERYNVSQYSPSYGMSYDDAVSIIPQGTMYVPTVAHSENLIPDETVGTDEINVELLSAGTLEERETDNQVVVLSAPTFDALEVVTMQTYDFEVDDGLTYRYEWTGKEWVKGASVAYGSECNYDGTTDLWYCTEDTVVPMSEESTTSVAYNKGTLYKWQSSCWYAIATVNDSLLSRSLSLVRQTADSYSVELRNVQGDFSQYKQTVDEIGLLVHGSDGSTGELHVTKEGIIGEILNRTGNSATLKAQADATQAVLDMMISGLYHKLEQALTDNVPKPYGAWDKYSVRPEWSVSLGKFVFDVDNESEDGIYYFFDEDETHYCKVVGNQYEVYTIGKASTAGTDAHITEEYANINTLAYFGDDETSTIAGLRNIALEGKAQIQLLASLDTNKLNRVVNIYGYTVPNGTKRYAKKPSYLNDIFTFDGQVEDTDGKYFLINSQQFGKLVISNQGSCYGYEVYDYGGNSTAGLVSTVLDNQASVGLVVDVNGVRGGVLVEAINNQTTATINADKINLNGYVTIKSLESGGTTEIDGSRITTGVIQSSDYNYSSGDFSTDGTAFDLTNGSITSKNFAIDGDGNLYLKSNINVGLASDGTYNFVVDSNGNVEIKGILNATDLRINGNSILTTSDKIMADYLELKGITIYDRSGNVTFKVDSNGYVTISGTVKGSISWGDIVGVPSTVTQAYNLADSAYDRATTAMNDASNVADTVSGWTYKRTTYIDGSMLKTGTVMASSLVGGEVILLTESEDTAGAITISDASTADYAVDLTSYNALRVQARDGALFLSSHYNFINISNSKYISIGDSAGRSSAGFVPADDGNYNLGAPNYKWQDIYATNDVINTSDKRKKKDISYDLQKYESFFCSLKPTQYKFINNTSDRYHIGFISQDIENALVNNGLESSDFAGFIKSPIYTDESETTVEDCQYGLRYGEFIALNTHMIQKLYAKIDELETKIQQLENVSTKME